MVMWIGYLQWHFRVYGDAKPSEPILRNFEKIRQTDALLSWSREELVRDAVGRPITRARLRRKDGDAPVLFPVVEEREVVRLIDPRPTPWPDVHFIIGNPPFIGGKDLRRELGDGYVDALWQVRQGRFRSADLVTAWWDRAADILTAKGSNLRRFGFITTNSITQTFSRRVLEHHLKGEPPMRLVFSVPDHPWIKGGDSAAVRIAMTVAERGEPDGQGRLLSVVSEAGLHTDAPEIVFSEERGTISADLSVNAPVSEAVLLKANAALAMRGVQLMGAGFIVAPDRAAALLSASEPEAASPIRAYRNGRDLADRPRGVKVIDLFGWEEAEVRRRHPAIFQHVLETVKPERDRNNRASYRDNWWIFGEPRRELRPALEGLRRYIATVETAKHRWFRFLDADILPDNKLVVIASDDAAILGVLSSRLHKQWFVANSARIGVYDGDAVYVKSACFDAFPFPDLSGRAGAEIAVLADEIDGLRARVIAQYGFLSMTGLYNARVRLAAGAALCEADRAVHDAGCIGLLDHLHRRLDGAVLSAYGWPADLPAQEAVARLVALNRERANEEARGEVRFLRPDFQLGRVKTSHRPVQVEATLDVAANLPSLPDAPGPMASALLHALRQEGVPVNPRDLAARFGGRRGRRMEDRIEQTLAVLAVAGSVQRTDKGWFTPRRV
ncbi:hypothetical protein D3C72_974660 [compost metagenome]